LGFPAEIIDVPTHGGDFGLLGVIESHISAPFNIKRVYFLYWVPTDASRGAHGHKDLEQLIIPIAGSFKVSLDDGHEKRLFTLDDPSKGLHLRPGLWRDLHDFSENAIALVLASELYDEDDYMRNYKDFLAWTAK
jgi:hypothetical protein